MKSKLLALSLAASAALAIFSGCAPTMSNPVEYAERPISKEAGADYFMNTGGGDPYATGMAYPVFLALMEQYPNELGKDFSEFEDKFGFYPAPDAKNDVHAVPIGFHLTVDPNSGVPWLVGNCQLCHTERIRLETGDIMVPGLGNKRALPHAYVNAFIRIGLDPNLDDSSIEKAATRLAKERGVSWQDMVRGPIVKATLAGLRHYGRLRRHELALFKDAIPGRMATIESFALALDRGLKTPITLAPVIGYTKPPDVRSFPFRETFSYDGSGFGAPTALVLEADFLAGTRPEWYLSHPHIATSMYLFLRGFTRDLKFPKPVDEALVAKGKEAFEGTCAHCHGYYDKHEGETRVSYKEKIIPLDVVGTDPARVLAVTPSFVAAANSYPLTKGYTSVRNTGGYVPPVLLDVWARGVYGHVGQWPSLAALATAPDKRPSALVVDTNGLYDLARVGVRYEEVEVEGDDVFRIENGKRVKRDMRPGEYVYDGKKAGFSVLGHPFLADMNDADRKAVIEYLKTI